MNLGQLRSQAYEYLQGSSVDGVWPASQVDRHINDAQYMVHQSICDNQEDFFATSTTINEVAGTKTYSLPTDCYRVAGLSRVADGSITLDIPVPFRRVSRGPTQQYWEAYNYDWRDGFFVQGQKRITLTRASTNTTTGSIQLDYIYRPAEMKDDLDEPFQQTAGASGAGKDNLVEWHDMLWVYAARWMAQKEEAFALADRLEADFRGRQASLMQYLSRMNIHEPRYVNQDDDFWDLPGGV